MAQYDGILALERMERAVFKVRERLLRATGALEAAGVPYAVVGGNAVGAWVEQIDESAVRTTQDVDLVVRRVDFDAVKTALESVGFIFRHAARIDMFLDGPGAKARDAVHILFSGEKVREGDVAEVPDVAESTSFSAFRVLDLESLVRMKLTAYRRKDQVHLLDMIGVGLVDDTWPAKYPTELADRLQHLLDTPDE
ncbi:MAG: hypothetical protein WD851_00695 [Pirellulales bacterium]